jgi:hypothetical protein
MTAMNAMHSEPFAIDADLGTRLDSYRKSSVSVFRRLAEAAATPPWTDEDIERWARHPLGMGLSRLATQGDLTPDELRKGMDRLQQVPSDILRTIEAGRIAIDTDGASFSLDFDRGVDFALIPLDRQTAQSELDDHLAVAISTLGESWRSFIRPVATICLVDASGYTAIPHYSGSSNSLFGAMQAGRLSAPWITAEVLTHEAAHMWLSLVEDQQEFADDGWTTQAYLSPWRDDPRPISGVVHGVYVFSMVAAALARWIERGGSSADAVLERLALVCAQVRSAAATVQGHTGVIPFVRSMTQEALERIERCEQVIPADVAGRARARLADHAARWRAAYPHLVTTA